MSDSHTSGGQEPTSLFGALSEWWRDSPQSATGWIRTFSTTDPEIPNCIIDTGHGRGSIAIAHGAIWVANAAARTVVRIDPGTLELTAVQKFRKMPIAIAAGPSAVWALGLNGWLWRIWPDGREAEGVMRVGRRSVALDVAGGLIWALRRNGHLAALEPATEEIVLESRLPGPALHMSSTGDQLWVSCRRGRRVVCVDPTTGGIDAEVPLPRRARCLAASDSWLLVGCAQSLPRRRGWLSLLDLKRREVVSTLDLPSQPRAIAIDGDAAWVACGLDWQHTGTIERIDLTSGETAIWRTTEWVVSDLALTQNTLLAAMSVALATPAADGGFVGAGGGGGGDCGGGSGGGGSC